MCTWSSEKWRKKHQWKKWRLKVKIWRPKFLDQSPIGALLKMLISSPEFIIRGFDLLQSCTTQRQAGIFAIFFFFTNDEHAQRDVFPLVELSPRLWALCFDDMTTSRTSWDLTGTSNGGRSFTKSMHRKSALPFGISNSNNIHEKITQFWLAEKGVQLFCNTSAKCVTRVQTCNTSANYKGFLIG